MEWILAIQDAIGKALTTIQSMKAQVISFSFFLQIIYFIFIFQSQ